LKYSITDVIFTWPAIIAIHDFITLIIFRGDYKLWIDTSYEDLGLYYS